MKKILFILFVAVAAVSCEDFLDSANYTEANTANYPAQASDLNKELAALYGVMNQFSTDPLQTYLLVNTLMSDDCNGAGGTGDVECTAIGHLMTNKDALYDSMWKNTYVGIARANAVIFSVDAFEWTDTQTRNQLLGEAYFMRGLFYMWGSQFWGDIPAYWAAAAPDPCPQQSAEEVIWPHIMADFLSAYNLMTFGATTQGDGHATKGAAAGYLARAYMFYQGFYKKAGELASASLQAVAMPTDEEGNLQEGASASLSKDDVVKALETTMSSGQYGLIEDFRLLWQYTNKYTAPDYDFVADLAEEGKYWAGNGNKEQLFQIQYGNLGQWSGTIAMGFCNMTSLYLGLRCGNDVSGEKENGGVATFPFGQGWGQGVFNAKLVDDWSDADPRKAATVLDVEAELDDFAYVTDASEETGYYNKKFLPVTTAETAGNDKTAGPYTWWGIEREALGAEQSNANCMQGEHYGDVILMRYSDVLLMHSELTGTADGMNQVRARAGLGNTSYSWANIKSERRFEFAGEGLRFNDLRRWSGQKGGSSCEAAVTLEGQNGTKVNYCGNWTTMHHAASSWAERYAKTDGFLPIPPGQISVVGDESVLKQNEGWGSSVADANLSASPVY